MRTRITEMFGIDHPVVLAPMGGVAGGALAAAVTRAGGLGIIGCGYGDPRAGYGSVEWIDGEFQAAGNEKVGAGFITWSLAKRPELLDRIIDRGSDPIFLSFGDPGPFIPAIRAAGRRLILQVGSLAEARAAASFAPDVIVAQGAEAGGHGYGRRSLMTLLPEVVDAVAPIPVLAAGGISDGRGLAAALMLGADGVLLGTRLFASREALGADAYKQRIIRATGDDTLHTRVFDIVRELDWPEGYGGRAIPNRFSETWHGREAELAAAGATETEAYHRARIAGDVGTAVVFAGEGIGLIDDCPPAAEIIERMVREAEELLRAAPRSAG
ncbi:MAG TPA: nitronate monooxygenase family protein [Aestuariivirgaceae bacterium]|nr:nitronate monooxygenase family protein [Aestuariivirgaceae bacterium]